MKNDIENELYDKALKFWNIQSKNLSSLNENFRKEFYKSKFNCVKFSDINTKINFEDIDKLNYISGVWSIWNKDESICMDVAQTQNIGNEILMYIRRLDFNKYATDEEIKIYNEEYHFYNHKKFRDIHRDCQGEYLIKLVVLNKDDKIEREKIEAQYAHDHQARYWNPAPGQKIN